MAAANNNDVVYPDYEPTQDFPCWITGYFAKVRDVHGFKLEEEEKVKEEVVHSIAGKLTVGSALDAYSRLTAAERNNYDMMVARLTDEFTDPSERLNFRRKSDFNKRKKGQKLHDFIEEIKWDVTRYSGLQNKITQDDGTETENPEKEREGVRRFKAGLRMKNGKKSAAFRQHIDYHLQEDSELTWDNAFKVASRWEMAYKEEEDGVRKTADTTEGETGASGDVPQATKSKKEVGDVESETAAILALSDQVEENRSKIGEIALVQETIVERLDTINANMQIMMAKLDASLGLNDPNNVFLQPIPDYYQVPVDPWVHYPSQEYPPIVCNELEQA